MDNRTGLLLGVGLIAISALLFAMDVSYNKGYSWNSLGHAGLALFGLYAVLKGLKNRKKDASKPEPPSPEKPGD